MAIGSSLSRLQGRIILDEPMVAYNWKGLVVVRRYAKEIHITKTSKLVKSQDAFTKYTQAWPNLDLSTQDFWDYAVKLILGGAYKYRKSEAVSFKGAVIRRSRSPVMSGMNFFVSCSMLGESADFDNLPRTMPPFGSPTPCSPLIENAFYDHKLEAAVVEIQEPALITYYDEYYPELEFWKTEVERSKKLGIAKPETIKQMEDHLKMCEAYVRRLEAKGKSLTDLIYRDARVILWVSLVRVFSTQGTIVARIDLPFKDIIGDPKKRGRIIRIAFQDIPVSFLKIFPTGFVSVKDLSSAKVTFQAETIVALKKDIGAVPSAPSNIAPIKTPQRTHPAALEIVEKLHSLRREYRSRQKMGKVIYKEQERM